MRRIEQGFQPRMGAPHLPDHLRRPVEVLAPPESRPVGRREVDEIAQVGDLVGQLDQLGPMRSVGGMFKWCMRLV